MGFFDVFVFCFYSVRGAGAVVVGRVCVGGDREEGGRGLVFGGWRFLVF